MILSAPSRVDLGLGISTVSSSEFRACAHALCEFVAGKSFGAADVVFEPLLQFDALVFDVVQAQLALAVSLLGNHVLDLAEGELGSEAALDLAVHNLHLLVGLCVHHLCDEVACP